MRPHLCILGRARHGIWHGRIAADALKLPQYLRTHQNRIQVASGQVAAAPLEFAGEDLKKEAIPECLSAPGSCPFLFISWGSGAQQGGGVVFGKSPMKPQIASARQSAMDHPFVVTFQTLAPISCCRNCTLVQVQGGGGGGGGWGWWCLTGPSNCYCKALIMQTLHVSKFCSFGTCALGRLGTARR